MDKTQWQALMGRMSIPDNVDTYDALVRAYSEKHRHYHTGDHVSQCLGIFEQFRDLAGRAEEVELAIWFHDAIYKPTSKDNEAKSADWASEFLTRNGQDECMIERNRELIMATVHSAPATDEDAQLLVDIDLSILGSEPSTYRVFETNVRREYTWVPAVLFRRERRKILQSFLDRDPIYSVQALRDQYEAQARENLANAVKLLE